MSFFKLTGLTGAAVALAACLSAAPSLARPINQQSSDSLIAQENVPPREGVPQLNRDDTLQENNGSNSQMTEEVRGKVTRISGDQVEIQTAAGRTRTYEISEADQERNRIDVGSEVVLTVRGDSVVAISPAGTRSSSGSTSTSGSSSSSSSTMRRETTVQQTQTRPAPAPAPAASPEPQPVRGLW